MSATTRAVLAIYCCAFLALATAAEEQPAEDSPTPPEPGLLPAPIGDADTNSYREVIRRLLGHPYGFDPAAWFEDLPTSPVPTDDEEPAPTHEFVAAKFWEELIGWFDRPVSMLPEAKDEGAKEHRDD